MDEQIDGTGEVIEGDPGATATETLAETTAATDTTPPAEPTAAAAAPAPAKPAEEQFIDPATLPDEIKPHWRRMHGAYNKRLEGIRARQQDIDLVDTYRKDPEFARRFLTEEARRLGLEFAAPNGAAAAQPATAAAKTPANGDGPPPELIERIRQRYAPELQWMAEQEATAAWETLRYVNAPKEREAQERQMTERQAELAQVRQKLSEAAPGWEEHESDIHELLRFMHSPALTHPRFGSKLDILYRTVAPSNGAARVEAIRAQAEAAKNASRTGQPGRSTITNVADRVRKASTPREAIAIAAEEAERELRGQGVAVPD